jgi:flagellar basal-body rod protein FlgG
MNDSLYIAATGMQAQQLNIDSVANNLANVTTTGFKKSQVSFRELMQAAPAQGGAAQAGNAGLGISASTAVRDFTAGALTRTNAKMDLAVDGSGFIGVTLPDGTHAYSRGGTLRVSEDSYLATGSGYVLSPSIHIPEGATSITIAADGKVSVQTAARAEPVEVGQIELANFANATALKGAGSGVYVPTEGSGDAIFGKPGSRGFGTLAQGALEASNVSMVDEMVTLMIAQRAYEMSSKVIQASDEIMALTNKLRG